MIPHDSDGEKSPIPSQNGRSGTRDAEKTGPYSPVAGWPITPGGASTRHERVDFLGAPQAAGEPGRLGHYRVLKLLGEGGMGLVFLAQDSLLSRPVALKVIRPEIAGTPGIAQRFLREAQAAAAIKHDHIVTIYQVGQENGIPFLAMEYLKGMSLAQWLERGHAPSVEVVLRIGREIAAGLSAAHRHGLIHRDIKPANIWLEAPSGRVKILDFGLARSERDDVEISRNGTVMGTPAYMAPEQARGEPAGASSDLFSLGCVLYRLCTLRLPFEGDSIIAVLRSISTETPAAPRTLNDRIPPSLNDLIMRLLHKMPEARPVSAEVVVKELRNIERELLAQRQNAEPLAASPLDVALPGSRSSRVLVAETSPIRSESKARARRRSLAVAAVLAVLVFAATVGFVLAPTRNNNAATIAEEPTSAPAGERVRPVARPQTDQTPPAQAVARDDRVAAGAGRGGGSVPSAPAGLETPRSAAVAKPGLSAQNEASQPKDRLAGRVAPSDGKMRNAVPAAHIADPERAPEGRGLTARENGPWGDAVDPDGDCKFELDPREDKIRIIVPGKPNILSAEIGHVNAPRVLREIKGDFDLIVRVTGTGNAGGKATTKVYYPYHGAGLLIWQDEENYVRLEIATEVRHGKTRPYVNFEYRKDGTLATSGGLMNTDGSNHLRLRRRGDEIYASFGPDGLRWTSFAPLTAKLNDRLTVGISAINSSTKPLTAEFNGLEVLEKPGSGVDLKTDGLNR